MIKRTGKKSAQQDGRISNWVDLDDLESFPTMKRARLANGMLVGLDGNTVWYFGKVPTAPVVDARNDERLFEAFEPIHQAFEALARDTPVGIKRRSVAKNSYRQVHLLRVTVPRPWRPVTQAPASRAEAQERLNRQLRRDFAGEVTDQSILAFGVALQPQLTSSGIAQAWESVKFTLMEGGTPIEDFEHDLARVKRIFARIGIEELTGDEISILDSWWNGGRSPDVVTLTHPEHLHVFSDSRSVRAAKNAGPADCENWRTELSKNGGHNAISFATVSDLELDFDAPNTAKAHWAIPLLKSNALAISIRGALEPAKVTRAEIRRNRRGYRNDIIERQSQGKMSKGEQEERLNELKMVEDEYGKGRADATLINTSILVAFDGIVEDMGRMNEGALELRPMEFRQERAWAEMMICSTINANPNLHDMPITNLAASGISNVSTVGDKHGIHRGFTERDRQSAWYSPEAAYLDADAAPLSVNVAASGAGKTMMLQWEAWQTAELGFRQVVIDPKGGSDLSPVFSQIPGARIFSLDDLQHVDGVFDPLKFAPTPQEGIEYAASTITTINPYGNMDKTREMESDVLHALRYGVEKGHRATWTALERAANDGQFPKVHLERLGKLSSSSPMFGALVGRNDEGSGLALHDGTTLIKVGNTPLNLPEPGHPPDSIVHSINMALVRNMVFGSAMAMTGHGGVLRLDEAWVFTSAAPTELEKLGRLARSQGIQVELYTQRISDALNAGLQNYLTRGCIMHVKDPVEAEAACNIFKLDPSPARLGRITADATLDNEAGSPNWRSLKALKDPKTGKVVRGAVALYVDIKGRVVPTEIRIPERFFKIASTNLADVRAREEESKRLLETQVVP
ncbi:ATP-binding protein [Nesterenkonia rhizosphaerae]|uniref:AAA domain-containing protein n=1 Tax=Nesterenkonia rhizosphaerae TaxID=1348272 RepID=A0ABP9G0J4_9MICC